MLKSKPISELSDQNIMEMTEEDLCIYEDNVISSINEDNLAYASKREKYHNLALILKKRTIDYAVFQKEAFDLKTEIYTLKINMSKHQTEFIQLKRDWERFHGKNRVVRVAIAKTGKEVLML